MGCKCAGLDTRVNQLRLSTSTCKVMRPMPERQNTSFRKLILCTGLQVSTLTVTAGQVSGLPGLAALTRVDDLSLYNTAMRDLTSFQGLSCSLSVYVGVNRLLQTLAGLDNLQALPRRNGPLLSLGTGPTALTAAGLAPLRLYAVCGPDNSSPWGPGGVYDNVCRSAVRPGLPCRQCEMCGVWCLSQTDFPCLGIRVWIDFLWLGSNILTDLPWLALGFKLTSMLWIWFGLACPGFDQDYMGPGFD